MHPALVGILVSWVCVAIMLTPVLIMSLTDRRR